MRKAWTRTPRLCTIGHEARLAREDRMIDGIIVDGALVPVIAVAALVAVWIIVLYGSRYFGPR
jgi:hypothetical protein